MPSWALVFCLQREIDRSECAGRIPWHSRANAERKQVLRLALGRCAPSRFAQDDKRLYGQQGDKRLSQQEGEKLTMI
jgi:hypothetical protein